MSSLLSLYKKSQFNPGFIGVFINPFYFIRKRLYIAIRKNAPLLKGCILDLGCGSKPYKHLFVNAIEYIGVDIENTAHDHSKENVDVYYDGKTIPFDNNHFDAVFFSEVLEHVFHPIEIIKEIKRVLKDNGILFLTTPFAWDEHEEPNDYARYTSFGIKYLLEKNGFEIINFQKTGHFTEVLSQLILLYLRHVLYTKNKYFNIVLNILFIAPFTIIGIVIASLLPRVNTLYFSNILLVKKKLNT